MNTELIEDLRWQARTATNGVGSANISYAFTPQMLEEYTKLVVQECIKIIDPPNDLCGMMEMAHRGIDVQNIKEHFGVE